MNVSVKPSPRWEKNILKFTCNVTDYAVDIRAGRVYENVS
jgi:hypothetical protein